MPYIEYTVNWLDWDFHEHNTIYRPTKTRHYDWWDKRQLRSRDRVQCRQILQRTIRHRNN